MTRLEEIIYAKLREAFPDPLSAERDAVFAWIRDGEFPRAIDALNQRSGAAQASAAACNSMAWVLHEAMREDYGHPR